MTTTPPTGDSVGGAESTEHTSRYGPVFWLSVGVGGLLIGYGLLLLLNIERIVYNPESGVIEPERIANVPFETARRFAIILLLNDLVLLPLAFGFAVIALRWLPAEWRPPARSALFISAMVILIAIWGLAGQAIEVQPGNDQVLPNNYPKSVAMLLTPIWLLTFAWGWRAHRQGRHRDGPSRS